MTPEEIDALSDVLQTQDRIDALAQQHNNTIRRLNQQLALHTAARDQAIDRMAKKTGIAQADVVAMLNRRRDRKHGQEKDA